MLKSKLRTLSFTLMLTVGLTAAPAAILQPSVIAFAAESSVTTATISEILKNQKLDGGWQKNYAETSGEWAASTIDNGATYTEIRKLAAEYSKTKNSAYSTAVIKGINFLVNMQYSNGGWPQVYKSSGYHSHITYNDDAMVNVMILLDEVANKKGDFSFIQDNTLIAKSKASVNNGVRCLLDSQYKNKSGNLTVWGQQHNENTLLPDGARAYELPSLCAKESANIVKFLKTRPSDARITASIKAAEAWFESAKIKDTVVEKIKDSSGKVTDVVVKTKVGASPIWARFYDLNTNKPIFVDRDGVPRANLSEIGVERRTGYLWYGAWGSSL